MYCQSWLEQERFLQNKSENVEVGNIFIILFVWAGTWKDEIEIGDDMIIRKGHTNSLLFLGLF